MLRRLFLPILNFIAPPTCASCQDLLAITPHTHPSPSLCGPCFADLRFHTQPQCGQCATRVEEALFTRDDLRCGLCLANPPAFIRTRAPFVYTGTARQLILAHKHGAKRTNAEFLARHMHNCLPPSLNQAILIPVPLHPSRLRRRGFNQSLDLARGVARELRREREGERETAGEERLRGAAQATDQSAYRVYPDAIQRTRATESQGSKNPRARERNMMGAFDIKDPSTLKGKDIILIDDVMTTGATARALSKVLLRAGAGSIQVLAAARALPK